MKHQLIQLIIAQFREFFREPGALFWSFAFPILMAWGLGIAFSNKGEIIRHVAVIEDTDNIKIENFLNYKTKRDQSKEIVEYEKIIENDKLGKSIFKFIPTNWDNANLMLKRGKVAIVVSEENGNIQYHFDPANPEAQLLHLQLSSIFDEKDFIANESSIKPLTSIGTRYVDFLIPGLMVMGIMMSCMWGISYNLIDKRSKKLMRRMIATPMKKSNFLLSQLISRTFLTSLESLTLVLFAFWYFDIVVQGSWIAFLIVFLAGNFAFIGLSILISSRTSNPQVGNGLINFITMPMMILSGIFFSYHNFPDAVIPFIQKLPLTMFADSVRSIFIEGATIVNVLDETLVLGGTGLITFVAGLKMYKWY